MRPIPLPYAPDALAPALSREQVLAHYTDNHRGYWLRLQRLIGTYQANALQPSDVTFDERAQAAFYDDPHALTDDYFNSTAMQVENHNLYWRTLSPDGGGDPPVELLDRLRIGSPSALYDRALALGTQIVGSGYLWFWREPQGLDIHLWAGRNAINPPGKVAIGCLDLWEHAYAIDYGSDRRAYLTALLDHLVDWNKILRS